MANFYRSLDKNQTGTLEPDETADNDRLQERIREAGLDPSRSVSIQELSERRSRQGGGFMTRIFGGQGGNSPGGAPGRPGAPQGFGETVNASPGSAEGGGGEPRGDARRGPRGGRPSSGDAKTASAKKSSSSTDPGIYRFRTTQELLPKGLPDWFIGKDANQDGQVSMAEYARDWNDEQVRMFRTFDKNGDGVIATTELLKKMNEPAAPAREEPRSTDIASTAEEADYTADEDAAPTPAVEYNSGASTAPSSTAPATAAPANTNSASTTSASDTPTAEWTVKAREYVVKYDKNDSGVMERDEWPPSNLTPPAQIDANGDGTITVEEVATYFHKRFGK
jgi:hypothetical protein